MSRWGEHESAEAVIRHLAEYDHDCDAGKPGQRTPDAVDAEVFLRYYQDRDGVVAEAVGELGMLDAVRIYRDVRETLLTESAAP